LLGRGALGDQLIRTSTRLAPALADFCELVSQILAVPKVGSESLDALDFLLDLVPLAGRLRPSAHALCDLHHATISPVIPATSWQTGRICERSVAPASLDVLFC